MSTLEKHLKKISVLEKDRDDQREKMDVLLAKKKSLDEEIKNQEAVLKDLDESLERLEEQCLPHQQQQEIKAEPSIRQHEGLTSSSTQLSPIRSEEILTDPLTQTQSVPAPPKAARVSLGLDENDVPLSSLVRRTSSAGSSVGQLEITKLPSKKKKAPVASAKIDQFFAPTTTSSSTDSNVLQITRTNNNHSASTTSKTNAAARSHANDRFRDSSRFPWSQRVQQVLQETFHIQQFRENQKEVINCTLAGEDVFVLMRTGGGKSLTYQLPALLEGRQCGKVTLVISPLLSLIKDQEDQMNQFAPGSALSFTSNLPGGQSEHTRRWNLVRERRHGVCLVLVTPEKIHKSNKLKSELEKLQAQGRLGRFVVDEAHCCSNWGHDFRPDYTKLGFLRTHFPDVPIMAVTATASDRVRFDVCDILNIPRNCAFFRSTANRPNLTYEVRAKRSGDSVVDDMAAFIKEEYPHGSGIVYTYSRKDADTVAGQLCDRGIVAQAYHSSVTPKQKDLIHQSWMHNDTQVVVATIAFGLGINKPDVRFVLHHSLSKNLEAYYQESGRAGRDGNPAKCILYYCPKDVIRMIKMVYGTSDGAMQAIWQMAMYAQENGGDMVCRNMMLVALGEEQGNVEALRQREQEEGISPVDRRDIGKHAKTVTELLQYQGGHKKVTMNMLVKEWRAKADNAAPCVAKNPPGKDLTPEECERIVVCLLIEGVFAVKVVWNAYDSTVYLIMGTRKGPRMLSSPNPKVLMNFPKRESKGRKSTGDPNNKAKARKSVADEDGWLSAKKPAKKKGGKSGANSTKKKTSTKKTTTAKTTRKRKQSATVTKRKAKASKKTSKVAANNVIELSSSDDEPEPVVSSTRTSFPRAARQNASAAMALPQQDDLWDDDCTDSECEFDG